MPADHCDRIRRERRVGGFELGGEAAEWGELEGVPGVAGAGLRTAALAIATAGVVGEHRHPRLIEREERELRVTRNGRHRNERQTVTVGGHGDRLAVSDERHSRAVEAAQSIGAAVVAQMSGTVKRAAGERDLPWSRRHRDVRSQMVTLAAAMAANWQLDPGRLTSWKLAAKRRPWGGRSQ